MIIFFLSFSDEVIHWEELSMTKFLFCQKKKKTFNDEIRNFVGILLSMDLGS